MSDKIAKYQYEKSQKFATDLLDKIDNNGRLSERDIAELRKLANKPYANLRLQDTVQWQQEASEIMALVGGNNLTNPVLAEGVIHGTIGTSGCIFVGTNSFAELFEVCEAAEAAGYALACPPTLIPIDNTMYGHYAIFVMSSSPLLGGLK